MWAVLCHSCAQGVCHSSRLICSLMTSSVTSRLDFHHIKVDFNKSEVVQPLVCVCVQVPLPLGSVMEKETLQILLDVEKCNTNTQTLRAQINTQTHRTMNVNERV